MTPAQRKYDIELVASLRTQALQVSTRSRKISDTLKLAADRIETLSMSAPIEQPPEVDPQGFAIQPASTPDQAKHA